MQDEVISRLAVGLQIPLESRPSRRQINPQAYDLFLRGRHAYFRYGPKHFAESLGQFQSASNIDPNFAEALAYQSYCRTTMHVFSMPSGDPTLDQALSLAERSVALAPGVATTHARLGWVLGFLDRPDKTVDAFEKAISLDPGSAEVNHSFGETLNRLARPAEALGYLDRAFELESIAPASWDWCRGHSHVLLKDYEKALDRILPVLELVPGLVPAWVQLARLYAETGEIRQARLVVDRLRAVSPKFGIDHAKSMFPYPSEIERKRLISGLKAAGLD